MDIDTHNRIVRLSVGEFANYSLYPQESPPLRTGRWRAEVGTQWHNELRQAAAKTDPDSTFEVPINGIWREANWQFHLQGRIDQLIPRGKNLLLREIKTVTTPLPTDPEELHSNYPAYFRQIAAYRQLAAHLPEYSRKRLNAEVLFVEITEGLTQRVPLNDKEAAGLISSQARLWIGFLEDRRHSLERLRHLRFKPAFQKLREGQSEAAQNLWAALNQKQITLFEAPTGFGKTGLVFELALEQLRQGQFERLIFLSGKSTGQIQARNQLEAMLVEDSRLRYHIQRNQREHAIESQLHTCDPLGRCRRHETDLWVRSGIQPSRLLDQSPLTVEQAQQLGASTGLCPYEISRSVLPFAEVWIGDYNYLFSPRSSSVFVDTRGFDPRHTLLIIDEAHNLPGRTADGWSHRLDFHSAQQVCSELQFSSSPPTLRLASERLCDWLASLMPCEELELDYCHQLEGILESVIEAIPHLGTDPEQISPWALEQLWSFYDLLAALQHDGLESLLHVPEHGTFAFDCLSAAPQDATVLHSVKSCILMSATLSPHDFFIRQCALEANEPAVVTADAPWRKHAYSVAVDTRVDTRFSQRNRHLALTADTVTRFAADASEPVVIFFPSYRYAESVRNTIITLDNYINIALQPRGLHLDSQQKFLKEALLFAHALFLIMGSGFSESIDLLGGQVSRAMLVGPALPEVNAAQNKRMKDREHIGRSDAFREVYLVPAFIRIHQALGRLVRAPGQHASILLHGKRFAEPAYRELLAPEYRDTQYINESHDLDLWLDKIRQIEFTNHPLG